MTIPITLTHKGKEYTGDLSQVQGAGSTAVYHLMINSYYCGRLRLSAFDNRWVFDGEFSDLAEAFAAWLHFFAWAVPEYQKDPQAFVYGMIDAVS